MKTVVCFKAMADYARVPENDWVWDSDHCVDTRFVRRIFNCFEESALEMALSFHAALRSCLPEDHDSLEKNDGRSQGKIQNRDSRDNKDNRDNRGNTQGHDGNGDNGNEAPDGHLTALTIDDPRGDLFLKQLLAVGYDHAVRIACEECGDGLDLRINPLAVSLLMATHIQQEGYQLVIVGRQGGDGDNRQTGFFLAERLGWPCIRDVSAIAPEEKLTHCLNVTSQVDGATLIQTVQLPVVLIVGHSPQTPYLRVPNLKQKLKAKKRTVAILSPDALGIDDEQLTRNDKSLVGLHRPKSGQSCIFLEGATPKAQAWQLYDRYLKERIPARQFSDRYFKERMGL